MSKQIRGRFSKKIEDITLEYTESLSSDIRLALFDIKGSLAYAQELQLAGVISAKDLKQINKGLKEIEKELVNNEFIFDISLEDVHMNIEHALIKKIGDAGKKLHTGRSRNDQVVTDLKLYLKEELVNFENLLKNILKTLIKIAEDNLNTIMPGYTHLQVAQPVTLAHHLSAYAMMFKRDLVRIINIHQEIDECPLGAAALAGNSYGIDRHRLATALGFKNISENSMDAVSDRDYVLDFSQALALIMVHISRLSEEMIIWNSSEFNFISLDDRYSTGSSIMPQKKNPDILELARGRSALTIGNLTSLLTMIKGLPLTYNRDLQEDKKVIFDSIDITAKTLSMINTVLQTTAFNKQVMRQAAEEGYSNATDLADYLVKKGIPFRDSHEITGQLVQLAIKEQKKLQELELGQLQKFSQKIEKDIYSHLKLEEVIKRRNSAGGTAASSVIKNLRAIKKQLG